MAIHAPTTVAIRAKAACLQTIRPHARTATPAPTMTSARAVRAAQALPASVTTKILVRQIVVTPRQGAKRQPTPCPAMTRTSAPAATPAQPAPVSQEIQSVAMMAIRARTTVATVSRAVNMPLIQQFAMTTTTARSAIPARGARACPLDPVSATTVIRVQPKIATQVQALARRRTTRRLVQTARSAPSATRAAAANVSRAAP